MVIKLSLACSHAFSGSPGIKHLLTEPPGVKRGKGKDMENQNMENVTQQQGAGQDAQNQQQEEPKLFTQEEVSEIVQRRLARAKAGQPGVDYAAREQELNRRELQLDAREKLADAGVSRDYLPLVNCSSKEEMEKSIKLIAELTGKQKKAETGYRVISHMKEPEKRASYPDGDPDIRAAMGLKG